MKDLVKDIKEIVFNEKDKYSFKPELILLFFGFLICLVAWATIPSLHLFGNKSNSIFDIWSFAHMAFGAIISFFIIGLRKFDIQHPILFLLVLTSSWEILEHYLETIGPLILANWLGGTEHIMNGLVANQMSIILGFTLIKFKPKWFWIALIIFLGILIIHIFIGSSTYFY